MTRGHKNNSAEKMKRDKIKRNNIAKVINVVVLLVRSLCSRFIHPKITLSMIAPIVWNAGGDSLPDPRVDCNKIMEIFMDDVLIFTPNVTST